MEPAALTYRQVNRDVIRTLWRPRGLYWILLILSFVGVNVGAAAWRYQVVSGLGVTGLRNPTNWAIYITNFVFWIGIGHAGTLISAILFLFRAKWRTAVYRSAEAMTVFAVMTAGLFPLIHLGRPWFFYWLLPYPNQRWLQPNFRSPLLWDVFAVGTYFTVSVVFLYMGLVPDVAAVRDAAAGWKRRIYGVISLGWLGTERQWKHYRAAYGLLAALATPLVISVHSIVSWDFAMAIVPGWHDTIFAPYFVDGAIFSGLAMVIVLLIPLRKAFQLEDYITPKQFDNLAKLTLATSLILTYAYAAEFFTAWYSGDPFERASYWYRAFGFYWPFTWAMILCNCIAPLAFCFKKARTRPVPLFVVSVLVLIGMWLERFVIIVTSLAHDYDPYIWNVYTPRWVEPTITLGSFAHFFFWFLLFIKIFPSVAIVEVKEVLPSPQPEAPRP